MNIGILLCKIPIKRGNWFGKIGKVFDSILLRDILENVTLLEEQIKNRVFSEMWINFNTRENFALYIQTNDVNVSFENERLFSSGLKVSQEK